MTTTNKTKEYLLSHWQEYCIVTNFGGKYWACVEGIGNLIKKCPGGHELSVEDATEIIVSSATDVIQFVPLKELQLEIKSAIKQKTKLNNFDSLIKELDLKIFDMKDFTYSTQELDDDGCQLVLM